jgi:hypothetical protein
MSGVDVGGSRGGLMAATTAEPGALATLVAELATDEPARVGAALAQLERAPPPPGALHALHGGGLQVALARLKTNINPAIARRAGQLLHAWVTAAMAEPGARDALAQERAVRALRPRCTPRCQRPSRVALSSPPHPCRSGAADRRRPQKPRQMAQPPAPRRRLRQKCGEHKK